MTLNNAFYDTRILYQFSHIHYINPLKSLYNLKPNPSQFNMGYGLSVMVICIRVREDNIIDMEAFYLFTLSHEYRLWYYMNILASDLLRKRS